MSTRKTVNNGWGDKIHLAGAVDADGNWVLGTKGVSADGTAAPSGSSTDPGYVIASGRTPRVTASLSKPASATAYTDVDLIGNSLTAASVTPMSFDVTRSSGRISGARCVVEAASGALVTALLDFDLILFRPATNIPFAAGSYPADNGTLVLTGAAMKQVVGIFSFTNSSWNVKGQASSGYQSAVLSSSRPFAPFNLSALGVTTLNGIIMARAAWNPGDVAQTFDFMLDVDAD